MKRRIALRRRLRQKCYPFRYKRLASKLQGLHTQCCNRYRVTILAAKKLEETITLLLPHEKTLEIPFSNLKSSRPPRHHFETGAEVPVPHAQESAKIARELRWPYPEALVAIFFTVAHASDTPEAGGPCIRLGAAPRVALFTLASERDAGRE